MYLPFLHKALRIFLTGGISPSFRYRDMTNSAGCMTPGYQHDDERPEILYVLTKGQNVSSIVSSTFDDSEEKSKCSELSDWNCTGNVVFMCKGGNNLPSIWAYAFLQGFDSFLQKWYIISNPYMPDCRQFSWKFEKMAIRGRQTCCSIDKSTLLFTGGVRFQHHDEPPWLLHFCPTDTPEKQAVCLPRTSCCMPSYICVSQNGTISRNWRKCKDILPTKVICHSVIKIIEKQVLLIGGRNVDTGKPSKDVHKGMLSEDGTNVTWEKHPSLPHGRWSHITFKINGNIYVVGGYDGNRILSNGEVYNLRKRKWSKCEHDLPYPLCKAAVEVDQNETFAIISGGETSKDYGKGRYSLNKSSRKIIIYTEAKGFYALDSHTLKNRIYDSFAIAF